jgi:hypothetical protein
MSSRRKKISVLVLNCLLSMVVVSLYAQGDKDKNAIKAVIMEETTSFMKVDRKSWDNTWVQAPYVYWSYSDSTGTSFVEGWDNLSKTFDTYFRTQKPATSKIVNHWIEIRIYGNGAFVRFDQTIEDEIDHDKTSQVRVLEKKANHWKVVLMAAEAKYTKK